MTNEYLAHPLFRKHTLDSAMDSLWNFYKSYFFPLFIISLVFSLATTLLSSSIDTEQLMELASGNDFDALRLVLRKVFISMIPVILISLFSFVLLSLYIFRVPLDGAGYAALIGGAFRYFLTFAIIVVLFIPLAGVAFIAGLIVLIIGVLFSVVWLVGLSAFILPLLIAEGNDISNTIARSFKLFHRHFGSNLGWTAVFVLIFIVVSIVISVILMIPFAGSFLQILSNPEESTQVIEMAGNPLYIIFSSVLNALVMPAFPIFGFILYFNARARENHVE